MGTVRIRTADMVRRYLDDEDASRAVFRHGYFYSGDLGTFLPDGRLALNGRVNNVINLLGNKVAAEPIEMALQESLAVDGVCVLSMRSEGPDEEFHVVIESSRPIGKAELASSISSQLRGVPYARVHFLPALPRNDMGKIDRAALRQKLLSDSAAPAV
jgi:acyl-CoA synthetase (AMP-forming)/AMP-acid ligase II